MIIYYKQMIEILQGLWPNLVNGLPKPTNICIPRGRYWAPTQLQFENMVNSSYSKTAKHTPYIPDLYMCSNFAATLAVVADFYVMQLLSLNQLKQENKLEWAIGEVWGTLFHGDVMSHAIAGVFLEVDEKPQFWLMEPQPMYIPNGGMNYRAWIADPENDTIHLYKL